MPISEKKNMSSRVGGWEVDTAQNKKTKIAEKVEAFDVKVTSFLSLRPCYHSRSAVPRSTEFDLDSTGNTI